MLTLLRYIIQLILSPQNGWDDIADTNPDPDTLLRKGVYPLLGIAAVTEIPRPDIPPGYNRTGTYWCGKCFRLILCRHFHSKSAFRSLPQSDYRRRGRQAAVHHTDPMRHRHDDSIPDYRKLPALEPVDCQIPSSLCDSCPLQGLRISRHSKRKELRFTALEGIAIVAVPLVIYYVIYLLI